METISNALITSFPGQKLQLYTSLLLNRARITTNWRLHRLGTSTLGLLVMHMHLGLRPQCIFAHQKSPCAELQAPVPTPIYNHAAFPDQKIQFAYGALGLVVRYRDVIKPSFAGSARLNEFNNEAVISYSWIHVINHLIGSHFTLLLLLALWHLSFFGWPWSQGVSRVQYINFVIISLKTIYYTL